MIKFEDAGCCLPATLSKENLIRLPDRLINENDSNYFLPYQSVKFQDTEVGRPSLKEVKVKKARKIHVMEQETVMKAPTEMMKKKKKVLDEPSSLSESRTELQVMDEPQFVDFHLTTAHHGRTIVHFEEWRKLRVLYSKHV